MSLSECKPTSKLSHDELCYRLTRARSKGQLTEWEAEFLWRGFYPAVKRGRVSRKQLDKARLIVHEIRTGKRAPQEHVIDYLDNDDARGM